MNDLENLKLALSAITAVLTLGLGVLAWSLKRNLKTQDQTLDRIATDTRQLAGTVGKHGESLAAGVVRFQSIEKRLDGLEERERDRIESGANHHHRRFDDPVTG